MCIEIFEMFGAAFILVTTLMTISWIIGTIKNNVAIVDIGWGLSFFITGIAFFFLGDGFFFKRLVMATLVSAWSLRLAWHLWCRFDFAVEDPRYTDLRKTLGDQQTHFKMFLMFLFQGFLVIILSIPFAIIAGYSQASFHFLEFLGILVWATGFAGEYYADKQLADFKKDPDNAGKICKVGLWKYSRHPNYFFEWVIWIGFFLIAFPSPLGWLALISPVIMLILLTRVSGIPLAEQQALKSKGEAYKEYQKTTNAFIPFIPKG